MHDVEQTIERHIPTSDPARRLLAGHQDTFFSLPDIAEPDLAGVNADLIASALGARQETRGTIEERGVKVVRLRAVRAVIDQRLAPADLDPASAAGRLGTSVRYPHRLLEETGKRRGGRTTACRGLPDEHCSRNCG